MDKKLLKKFIEMYKENSCLWDSDSKEYANRESKVNAYAKLIKLVRPKLPRVNHNFVVRKINNLRTTFRKELRKVLKSMESNDPDDLYRPSLWYFHLISFISKEPVPEITLSKVKYESDDENFDGHASYISGRNHMVSQSKSIATADLSSTIYTNKNKCTTKNKPIRTAEKEQEIKVVNQNISCIDEFDAFGMVIATKLRKMQNGNEMQRFFCENIINQALFKGTLNRLSEYSAINDDLPTSSSIAINISKRPCRMKTKGLRSNSVETNSYKSDENYEQVYGDPITMIPVDKKPYFM